MYVMRLFHMCRKRVWEKPYVPSQPSFKTVHTNALCMTSVSSIHWIRRRKINPYANCDSVWGQGKRQALSRRGLFLSLEATNVMKYFCGLLSHMKFKTQLTQVVSGFCVRGLWFGIISHFIRLLDEKNRNETKRCWRHTSLVMLSSSCSY